MEIKCECQKTGSLRSGMSGAYDTKKELPFVNHKPGQCKCTNDLQEYEKNGKKVTLCSCCC